LLSRRRYNHLAAQDREARAVLGRAPFALLPARDRQWIHGDRGRRPRVRAQHRLGRDCGDIRQRRLGQIAIAAAGGGRVARGGGAVEILARKENLTRRGHAALEPNSGTASFSTALIVTKSSFESASSSAAIHFRRLCIGGSFGLAAMMPATPIS